MEIAPGEGGAPRLRVLVSGSTGLLGSALARRLSAKGHGVVRLVRPSSRAAPTPLETIEWDPARGFARGGGDAAGGEAAFDSIDAVVHLAGENLAGGPWTRARKQRILASRVDGTRALAEHLARMRRPPRTFVGASAVGWYGNRGDEILDESSGPGRGFLADVCRAWESAALPAREAGVRVVAMRFGVVLSGRGGALPKMAAPFRFGLGGVLGGGRQYFSWIALDDAVGAIIRALADERLAGPVNAVAPHAVTNRELTRTLGRVLGRPTPFPVPEAVLRWLLGEMAEEMLLSSARVVPRRLQESGFAFRFPELEGALRHELVRRDRRGGGEAGNAASPG